MVEMVVRRVIELQKQEAAALNGAGMAAQDGEKSGDNGGQPRREEEPKEELSGKE